MDGLEALAEVYRHYQPGSPGFVREVQTQFRFGCSDAEIERLGLSCKTAEAFLNDWAGAAYWTDEAAASRGSESVS